MPKRGSSFYLPEPSKMNQNNENENNFNKIDYSGWLYKWTNYVKGYRKRWFIIDSSGNLKYYRNPTNVNNGPSRGSIKLEEASIRSDQYDGLNIVITVPFSNNLHLRASNELDRSKWLKSLENAKHKAIKRSSTLEDDENENEILLNKTKDLKELEDFNKMAKELDEISAKFSNELDGFLHYTASHLNVTDAKKCVLKANSLKQLREGTLKLTDSILTKYKKEYESLCRIVNTQNEKYQELQKQYEILARQHSQLEGEALRISARGTGGGIDDSCSKNTGGTLSFMTALGGEQLSKNDENNEKEESEDLFQDATDTLLLNKFDHRQDDEDEEEDNLNNNKDWSEKSSSFCYDEEENNININLNKINNNESSIIENNNNLDLSKCKILLNEEISDYQENTQPTTNISNNSKKLIKQRRTKIPPKPESYGLNLWSIIRNCIGKELTKIPIPVNFNEPISMLQRITEDLEYSYLLDRASEKSNICERLAYISAFAISCYSATAKRTTKPFNPLLGETFEFDRRDDLGWRSLAEQVSHHPPAAAMHTEGVNWELSQEFMVASRFRGKYMSVIPTGYTHINFKDGKTLCTFQKVTTTVHNIIVGKLWIDNHGTMNIINHVSGERAMLKFHSYSYFSSERPRKVEGIILDKKGIFSFYIFGYWDSHLNIATIINQKNQGNGRYLIETDKYKRIWTVNQPLGDSSMFNFTKLAIEMNELIELNIAPTDSRFRPDQRLMENGDWNLANNKKNELEDKQRKARRKAEIEDEQAINNNQQPKEYKACWFDKIEDSNTGSIIHKIKRNDYWECKQKQDWSRCPNIY